MRKRGRISSSYVSFQRNKRGQVWVETVIYTLIAFVLIGAVLAFVRPKIQEFQDKAILDQTLTTFEEINNIIISLVQGGAGNKRTPELGLKKGTLNIDGKTDKLIFEMESRYKYSEPGDEISVGNTIVKTEEIGKLSRVTITIDYSEKYNITYQDQDISKILTQAANPYKIAIFNRGKQDGKTKIDFEVI